MKEIKRWIAGALMCALLLSDTALPAAFATQTGEGPVEGVFSADMDAESTDTTVDGVLSAVQTAEEASTEQIQNLNVEVQATTTASKSDAVYVMIDGKKYTPRVIRTATNDLSPTYSELPVHYYNGDSFTFKFSMDDSIDFDSLGSFTTVNPKPMGNDGSTTINASSTTLSTDKRVVTGTISTKPTSSTRLVYFYCPCFYNGQTIRDYRYDLIINVRYDGVAPSMKSVVLNPVLGTLTAYATDDYSGVEAYYFSTSSTAPAASATGWVESNVYGAPTAGKYYVWAKDRAGNVSGAAYEITVNSVALATVVINGRAFEPLVFDVKTKDVMPYEENPICYYNGDTLSYICSVNADALDAAFKNYGGFTKLSGPLVADEDSAGHIHGSGTWVTSQCYSGTISTCPTTGKPAAQIYFPVYYNNQTSNNYRYNVFVQLVLDNVAPRLTGIYNNNGLLTASAVDDNAGVDRYYFSTSSATPAADADGWQESNTYLAPSAGTYFAWAQDRAGNISNRMKVEVGGANTIARVVVDGKSYTPQVVFNGSSSIDPMAHPDYSVVPIHYYNGESLDYAFSFTDGIDFKNFGSFYAIANPMANDTHNTSSAITTINGTSYRNGRTVTGTIKTMCTSTTRISRLYLPVFYNGQTSNDYRYNLFINVAYDNVAPTVTASVDSYGRIIATGSDATAGVDRYYFSTSDTTPTADANGWQEYNIYYPSAAGTYYVWAQDRAGNVSKSYKVTVSSVTSTAVLFEIDGKVYTPIVFESKSGSVNPNFSTEFVHYYNSDSIQYYFKFTDEAIDFLNYGDFYAFNIAIVNDRGEHTDSVTTMGSSKIYSSYDKRTIWGSITTVLTSSTQATTVYIPLYYKGQWSEDYRYNASVTLVYDATAPTISKLKFSGTTLKVTASDSGTGGRSASGIAGYYISTSNTAPAASASGWKSSTSTTYSFTGCTQGTTYYVWAKDGAGNVSAVTQTQAKATIKTHPVGVSIKEISGAATFTTAVSAGSNLTYTWYSNTTDKNSGGTKIASCAAGKTATSGNYTIDCTTSNTSKLTIAKAGVTRSAPKYYYCVVSTTDSQTTTSNAATLTVYYTHSVTNPAATSVELGEKATFTVTASGGNPASYSYQWQVCKDGSTWNDLTRTSADTATYTSAAATAAMNGYKYRCVVSNGQYTVTSNAATLTVYYKPTVTPPAATTVNVGEKATFSVSTTGGNPATITGYQWYVTENGVSRALTASDGTGYNTATFQTNAATIGMSGNAYYCVLYTAQFTNIQSASAVLTVKDIAPGYVSQSDAGLTANGGTVSFTATFTGTNLTYTWYYATSKAQADAGNGVALASCNEGGNASGSGYTLTGGTGALNAQKTTTLTVTANLNNRGYYYYCKVTNSNGSARSLSARLKVKHTMNVSVTINDGTALQYSQALSLGTGETTLMNETFTSVSTGVVPSGVRLVSKGEVAEKHKVWGNTSANSKIGMTLQTSGREKDISSSLGPVSGITGVKLYIAAAYDRSDTVKITVTFTTDLGDQVILVISVAPITGKSVSFVVDNVANIQLEPGIKNSAKSDNVQITNTSAYPVDVSLGEVRTPDGVSNPFTIINQGDHFTSDDLTTSGVKLGVLSDGIKFYWDTTPSASQGVFAKLSGNGVTDGSDRKTFNYFMEFNPMYSGSLQNFKYQITYKVTASSRGVNE